MIETLLSSPYFIWPISIILAAFLFSLAVFIHELGHFLVARALGLRADVFSIGFGPALWKRNLCGTEIRLSAIPFGGYVSLPQLDPESMKQIQGEHGETLPPATPWKRILVALAGPLGNVVLAIICAATISLFAPIDATGESTLIGYVAKDSSGWAAGLRQGDKILAVNQEAVSSWSAFQTECFLSGSTNDVVQITYQREEEIITTTAVLDTKISETDAIYGIGGLLPGPLNLGVLETIEGSPAALAGLQPGDIILTVDDKPFTTFEQLTERPATMTPVRLTIQRKKSLYDIEIMPSSTLGKNGKPQVGVVLTFFGRPRFQWMAERGIIEQLKADSNSILRILKALTAPRNDGERGRAAKGLGGPIMIFGLFIQVIQTGIWASLGFLRLICVNLAVLNLLPLPVLDGGHILFALYALLRRKEPNARVISTITYLFSILLIGVMIWFLFSDVRRFILQCL